MVIRSPADRQMGAPDSTSTILLLRGSLPVRANGPAGELGHTRNSSWPQRQMMSSFRLLWQWHGVVQPLRAYISRSEYSAQEPSITSTRAYSFGLPIPKSVGSKMAPGGRAYLSRLKPFSAIRGMALRALRFIGPVPS